MSKVYKITFLRFILFFHLNHFLYYLNKIPVFKILIYIPLKLILINKFLLYLLIIKFFFIFLLCVFIFLIPFLFILIFLFMFYFHVINFNFYFSKNKFQLNIFLTYVISIIYNEQLNFYFLINETII